ncbi:olfactory receptor 2D2-like isoform X1 [Anguilla anguilla]|uniref:olfactory receptor 2D2-like isoform X1 n=1 Tax=Anguilla anguilla TaxID=7936 RepID=UPI0015B36140|nr:olfactory receptor 2D2-like isoform X1 [Anguilla anguilla]
MRNSVKTSSLTEPWERKLQVRRAGKMRARGANGTTEQTQNANQRLDYNQSHIQQFLIAGGELGLKHFYTELSVLLLVVYLLVLIVNLMVFFAVVLETKLHTPMYIFLSSLSLTDIIITTSVLPKMISVCLLNDIAISFSGCFLQQVTYLAFQVTEGVLLAIMGYDRYVAICNPLRYNDIITPRICVILSLFAWIVGILMPLPVTIYASRLTYCGDHVMFWFCDFPPVVALSCMDTTYLLFAALGVALLVIMIPAFVIIWTYGRIIFAILKITSVDGRKKAFSTCSSHLSIVILFYFAHLCVYISSTVKNIHPNVLILISIMNCFLTPVANPIIYSLRNKELKTAIRKRFYISQVFTCFSHSHPL